MNLEAIEELKTLLNEAVLLTHEIETPYAPMLRSKIARAARQHFARDAQFVSQINDAVKNRNEQREAIPQIQAAQATGQPTASRWGREWTGPSGKSNNSGRKNSVPVVVGKADVTNAPTGTHDGELQDPAKFVGMNPQEVLEYFGDTKSLKAYARELAIPLNYRLGSAKLTQAFVEYIDFKYSLPDEEEE